MNASKMRRQIAYLAARMMYDRQETEYYRAKMKAAKRVCQSWVKPADLPTNAEIRDEVQQLARVIEGDQRQVRLSEMRIAALWLMKQLDRFHPRLIGSVLTGHVRDGSDVDVHLFSDSLQAVLSDLEFANLRYEVLVKQIRKGGVPKTYRHVLVHDQFRFELTIYPVRERNEVPKSSITGKAIERASIAELEQLLRREYPGLDLDSSLVEQGSRVDPYQLYLYLLLPLESVREDPRYHPEGDALYHSLQVFDLARDHAPYDEELLAAALLHDVGKAIDASDHVVAGLEALGESITPRTRWLIENHMLAHKIRDGSLGARATKRLREHECFDDLMVLNECDRQGRRVGVQTSTVDESLDYLRELNAM